MRKLLAVLIMLTIAFSASSKPTTSTNIKTLNFATLEIETFKQPAPPTLSHYFFRYELVPTTTIGEWDVYLILYAYFSDHTEAAATSPTPVTVYVASPVSMSVSFPAWTIYSKVGTVNTGSISEYTNDISASFSPTTINGAPIWTVIKHM